MHPPVAERASAGQDRKRVRAVAVDAAVLDETVGFTRRAQAEHFEPEVDERREAVVDLREVDLSDGPTPALSQSRRAVSAPTPTMSSSGQCSGSRRAVGDPLA